MSVTSRRVTSHETVGSVASGHGSDAQSDAAFHETHGSAYCLLSLRATVTVSPATRYLLRSLHRRPGRLQQAADRLHKLAKVHHTALVWLGCSEDWLGCSEEKLNLLVCELGAY